MSMYKWDAYEDQSYQQQIYIFNRQGRNSLIYCHAFWNCVQRVGTCNHINHGALLDPKRARDLPNSLPVHLNANWDVGDFLNGSFIRSVNFPPRTFPRTPLPGGWGWWSLFFAAVVGDGLHYGLCAEGAWKWTAGKADTDTPYFNKAGKYLAAGHV